MARNHIRDEGGSGAGAVALPQFVAIGSVVGAEIERAVDVRDVPRASTVSAGRISLTSVVPALVPSLFHSSSPLVPSLARKYNIPFTFVRPAGLALLAPERMSLTTRSPRWCRPLPQLVPRAPITGAEIQRPVHVRKQLRLALLAPGGCP